MEGIIWLAVMIALVLIEIGTLGLTTIWFAVGALCAFLVALIGLNVAYQIAIFVVVSLIMLFFTRPVAVKYLNTKTTKTNAEALVGKIVRVTSAINNLKSEGKVTVNGLEWTARSTDDTITFKADEYVRIAGIEGVKLIVTSSKDVEQ